MAEIRPHARLRVVLRAAGIGHLPHDGHHRDIEQVADTGAVQVGVAETDDRRVGNVVARRPVPRLRDARGAELYGAACNGFYANTIMVAAYYAFVVVTLALGFALDARRAFTYKNKPSEICLANEKHRWGIYYVLVICLLVGYIMQNGGFGGASGFGMYANF